MSLCCNTSSYSIALNQSEDSIYVMRVIIIFRQWRICTWWSDRRYSLSFRLVITAVVIDWEVCNYIARSDVFISSLIENVRPKGRIKIYGRFLMAAKEPVHRLTAQTSVLSKGKRLPCLSSSHPWQIRWYYVNLMHSCTVRCASRLQE